MLRKIYHLLPGFIKLPVKWAGNFLIPLFYIGKERWCPVCEKASSKFRASGSELREDAVCVHCGALERHRFVWLYFSKITNLFDNSAKKMLHVAPEKHFESRLRKLLGQDYITADLFNKQAMVKMDIMDIKFPDGYFDVIYCSHVMEHIPDDKKAMREFYRVLKPGGWTIILVPINADKTFEDPSIVDPDERLRVFGQEDHVRIYGPDFLDRLRNSGFRVKVTVASDLFEKNDIVRMGLTPASGEIYYCTKH
jgi:SAM-dependent methyltransferase